MNRAEQIAAQVQQVKTRIDAAAVDAQRDPSTITLIAVTKTYPAADVDRLAACGITDVGENRHPEAGRKKQEVAADLRWHFVGGLQTNKAKAVARYADVIHSVDRDRLIEALSAGATAVDRHIDCLVQVNFDPAAAGRSGAGPDQVMGLARLIDQAPGLRMAGVMTVAPLGADPEPCFARLAQISAELQAVHPDATWISAGMSEDFAAAIAHGATHLRVGRALLGERENLQ